MIVAEVTLSLVETLNIALVPALMIFHGSTCKLLKVPSAAESYVNEILSDSHKTIPFTSSTFADNVFSHLSTPLK
ncbi:TPA: hypothetical protein DEP21_05695 [Patescibacteria group bacterium]|nr:hypothetical protein [Candidatus Gracilibacteria bacterium]